MESDNVYSVLAVSKFYNGDEPFLREDSLPAGEALAKTDGLELARYLDPSTLLGHVFDNWLEAGLTAPHVYSCTVEVAHLTDRLKLHLLLGVNAMTDCSQALEQVKKSKLPTDSTLKPQETAE
jgi:hypothetical protein